MTAESPVKLADTGLRIQPFQTNGKPVVLVPYGSHQHAIRFLDDVRANDHGLGLFLGPPLSGKTSTIRQFTGQLPDEQALAVVDGADKDGTTLLREILGEFGYGPGFDTDNERLNMIAVFAMQQTRTTQAPLLIIENAHTLGPAALQLLCDLAELRVKAKSALRIVLSSRKSMLSVIDSTSMQPLSKRMTGKFLLRPLTQNETADYVHKKLVSGGCRNPQYLAPREVCDHMHSASGGWPGMIDRMAMLTIANADRLPLRVEHVPRQQANPHTMEKSRASAPYLILTHQRKTLRRIPLHKQQIVIGRNELCDVHISHDWISRRHASLIRKDGTAIVIDLKSRNGTFVNGQRVARQVLANDDVISLGDHRLKFIDPTVQRTAPRGDRWDDTAIDESIENFSNAHTRQRNAS